MTDQLHPACAASFATQSLMATFGAEMTACGDGACTITAPITDAVMQQHGVAHAGLTFALGDSAAGYAALSAMPDGSEVMTAEMKINLLAPASGDRLVARGRVIKAGRRLVVVAAEVWSEAPDSAPRQVAILQGTMVPLPG